MIERVKKMFKSKEDLFGFYAGVINKVLSILPGQVLPKLLNFG